MPVPSLYDCDLDIDRLLNRYVPYPRWHLVPRPVAHFLGHRTKPPRQPGNVLIMLWSVVGVFSGLAIVSAVTKHIPIFQEHGHYTIINSFGAAAVLEYCSIDSPLAQPRNAFLGQIIASIIGVGIAKLFALHAYAESWFWLAGPVACAVAVAAMIFTKTIHPPAGAITALLLNNIQRQFPLYWWTPESLRPVERTEKDLEMTSSDDDERTPTGSVIITRQFPKQDQMIMIRGGQNNKCNDLRPSYSGDHRGVI
ncbi:predicted protein [Histoplasma mississippiense (nom. inval.)]|uniref:predicted protein n=1 Tax=Ajellomyces capsulatus (strain NAm1 / WU24) TaxID=2059318 RepID=UPI000157BDC0|nr:predicted protein [Histoplasma mississippiense (nom. inval.)]EDN06302.1 predicted protein [Histoplasma mississippiense (nom. inval.)]